MSSSYQRAHRLREKTVSQLYRVKFLNRGARTARLAAASALFDPRPTPQQPSRVRLLPPIQHPPTRGVRVSLSVCRVRRALAYVMFIARLIREGHAEIALRQQVVKDVRAWSLGKAEEMRLELSRFLRNAHTRGRRYLRAFAALQSIKTQLPALRASVNRRVRKASRQLLRGRPEITYRPLLRAAVLRLCAARAALRAEQRATFSSSTQPPSSIPGTAITGSQQLVLTHPQTTRRFGLRQLVRMRKMYQHRSRRLSHR